MAEGVMLADEAAQSTTTLGPMIGLAREDFVGAIALSLRETASDPKRTIKPLANGKFLHKLIPNSELLVMEGGGHLFLLSHSDESVGAIREFPDQPDAPERKVAA